MTNLSEAEIQVLASLYAAQNENTPTDKETLVEGGERYWIFREDRSDAFPRLVEDVLFDSLSPRLVKIKLDKVHHPRSANSESDPRGPTSEGRVRKPVG